MPGKVDYSVLVGQKFNWLTVTGYFEDKAGIAYFDCLCDCGNQKTVKARNIRVTKSCGCSRNKGG